MKKITRIIAAAMAAATIAVTASVSASATSPTTAIDSQFLNDMGLCNDRWGKDYIIFHWDIVSKAVDDAWKKAGVTSVTSVFHSNKYYINGKCVSRDDAMQYVADTLGRTLDHKKYFSYDGNSDYYIPIDDKRY